MKNISKEEESERSRKCVKCVSAQRVWKDIKKGIHGGTLLCFRSKEKQWSFWGRSAQGGRSA